MQLKRLAYFWNKVLIFYRPNSADYWHTAARCCVEQKPSELGRYYLDFGSRAAFPDEFDDDGVPLRDYGKVIGLQYSPIEISQYGLGLYELLYQSNFDDLGLKTRFFQPVDWLLKNATKTENNGMTWFSNYALPRYGLTPPWSSGMAQGEAISVLTRAHQLTGDRQYLDTALGGLIPYEIPVTEGGVLNEIDGCPIYEEFTTHQRPSAVLNGFIFALFGLYDLILAADSEKARRLFENGIETLINILDRYDLGYWSRYDLYHDPLINPAAYTYHQVHIEQLRALYILTGESIFKDYAQKWMDQRDKFINKTRALLTKFTYLLKIKQK